MEFKPDWVSPPGDTIAEIMEERGVCQAYLGALLVSDLLSGELPIGEALAARLEETVGCPAQFWLNREAQYREGLARGAKHD